MTEVCLFRSRGNSKVLPRKVASIKSPNLLLWCPTCYGRICCRSKNGRCSRWWKCKVWNREAATFSAEFPFDSFWRFLESGYRCLSLSRTQINQLHFDFDFFLFHLAPFIIKYTLFEKSNFGPKIQFWQKKKTFSQVFHPKNFW